MSSNFSLDAIDYKRLERAVAARFLKVQGRFNVAFLAQVFGWMFVSLAVMTFFKQWERTPDVARTYGVILLFAVLGFLLASIRPWAGQWLYRRYVAASNEAFTANQFVDIQDGSLILNSTAGSSVVPRSAIIDYLEDDRNHYLFVSGVQAIIIPKATATTLGADFRAFLARRADEV
jgi:hypothetical protein